MRLSVEAAQTDRSQWSSTKRRKKFDTQNLLCFLCCMGWLTFDLAHSAAVDSTSAAAVADVMDLFES